MKHLEKAQDYFERHSVSEECHITSDGRVFHTLGHALSFAQENQLEDQEIESYKREDLYSVVYDDFDNYEIETEPIEQDLEDIHIESETAENQETTEAPAEEIVEEASQVSEEVSEEVVEKDEHEALNAMDVATAEYNDVKALVKHYGIKTEDQKAETLRAALQEFKSNLVK